MLVLMAGLLRLGRDRRNLLFTPCSLPSRVPSAVTRAYGGPWQDEVQVQGEMSLDEMQETDDHHQHAWNATRIVLASSLVALLLSFGISMYLSFSSNFTLQ